MKPICVRCQRFYRMKRSGVYFVEQMPAPTVGDAPPALPGTAEPFRWQPYKLWAGDLWGCEGCGHELIHGTGRSPVAEHYQPDFAETRERLGGAPITVNDC